MISCGTLLGWKLNLGERQRALYRLGTIRPTTIQLCELFPGLAQSWDLIDRQLRYFLNLFELQMRTLTETGFISPVS